jgi:uncharacterized damage-inducible protein DinB
MNGLSRRALLRGSLLTAAVAAAPAFGQAKPAAPAAASADSEMDGLRKAFANSRAFTIEMANAMPDGKYKFQPVPEVRSFGQQMVHIADSLRGIYEQFVEDKKPTVAFTEAGKEVVGSKTEVLAKLETQYQYVQDALAKFDDARLDQPAKFFGGRTLPTRELLRIMLDHCTHHRAQTVVYLRLNGIKPAPYRA